MSSEGTSALLVSVETLMVPTGHSWNIMELQREGRVPDGEGQGGRCVFWSKRGISWNTTLNMNIMYFAGTLHVEQNPDCKNNNNNKTGRRNSLSS